MNDFKLTDKYGNVFDAVNNNSPIGDYLTVHVGGAWCLIPKDKADDPKGYLTTSLFARDPKSKLFFSTYFPVPYVRKFKPDISGVSYRCRYYDYMWRDKAGKWHIAYPDAAGHKDCKNNNSKATIDIVDANGDLICYADIDCKCPCHHNWDPKFATSFKDRMVKDDVDDADLINAMF